jgi:hypothetical protein
MASTSGKASNKVLKEITRLYSKRAGFIVSKDVSGQKAMHAKDFECIATDGKRHPQSRWERDIELENSNDYKFSVYQIDKVAESADSTVVYVTRRCAGANNKGKAFNTEIRLRDEWVAEAGLKLRLSETISRRVWLDGVEVSMIAIRPSNVVLLQGCGDYEN